MIGLADARVVRAAVREGDLQALRVFLAFLVEAGGVRQAPFAILTNHMTRSALARSIADGTAGDALVVVRARLVERDISQASVLLPIRMVFEWAATFTFDTRREVNGTVGRQPTIVADFCGRKEFSV